MALKQKDAVYEIVRSILTRSGGIFRDGTEVALSSSQREEAVQKIHQGLSYGEIQLKNRPENLRNYSTGLLSNWLRKDSRLNGGVQYLTSEETPEVALSEDRGSRKAEGIHALRRSPAPSPDMDGRALLYRTLARAGYTSPEQAIAEMTSFPHPDTVIQTGNRNLFRVIRQISQRGMIIPYTPGGEVMACDNATPTRVFEWSTGFTKGDDVQFNHVYRDSRNVELYTSLANVCVTPAFLAKLTDHDETIQQLLRYRVYDLYGFLPGGAPTPLKPVGYDQLRWLAHSDPVGNLERLLRERLSSSMASRAAISARKIGWLFSGFEPDSLLDSDLKAA